MEDSAVQSDFGKLHARHVAALVRHLIECRRTCDGDLDLFLVMTIIGERTFSARNVPSGMTHSEFVTEQMGHVETEAINVQSIADYSGIPRETVRRKVEQLTAKGWISRDAHRHITATDVAKAGLAMLTESSVRYLKDVDAALRARDTR